MVKLPLLLAFASALLAALYLTLRPEPTQPSPAPPRSAVQVFDLRVENGRVTTSPAVLAVTRGTKVVFRVHSDRFDELHLHGYDVRLRLAPGERVEASFVADRAGRFEYELHGAHRVVGALVVRPD